MDEVINRLQTDYVLNLFARNDVVLAYLFGSLARGESWAQSDVDIAVLFENGINKRDRFQRILYLGHELGLYLRRDDIQVVDLLGASPLLRHRVYYDGRLLYCPDDRVRVKFETTAIRDYVDTAPIRQLKAKYLHQRFSEGVD